jgi:hypothetical protein
MMLSLCFAVELFTEVRYRMPGAAMPFFIAYAALIPASAFADVHKRFKKKEQKDERNQAGHDSDQNEPVGDVATYRDRRHYHIR